ncbi:MAG: tetratricopeptide (TPR) repeat protein [Pirellulaceae bacterium]|jgi:tetratricopeptide (TPR) repeat protein
MRSLISALLLTLALTSLAVAGNSHVRVHVHGSNHHAGHGVHYGHSHNHYRSHSYRQFSNYSPYNTIRNSLSYGVGASLYFNSPSYYRYSTPYNNSRSYYSPSYYYAPSRFYSYPSYDYCPSAAIGSNSGVLLGRAAPRGSVIQPSLIQQAQVAQQIDPQQLRVVAKPVARGIKMQVIEHDWSSQHASREDVKSGDALFRDKDYDRALLLYDEAIKRSPELAEAHIRRAMTLVAKGEVENAAESFRKALGRTPNPMGYRFALRELYKTNEVDKQAHLDYVATKALKNQADGELFFVLGVMLHLDEQYNRASKFLDFAAKLDGKTHGDYVRRLLAPVNHNIASSET